MRFVYQEVGVVYDNDNARLTHQQKLQNTETCNIEEPNANTEELKNNSNSHLQGNDELTTDYDNSCENDAAMSVSNTNILGQKKVINLLLNLKEHLIL